MSIRVGKNRISLLDAAVVLEIISIIMIAFGRVLLGSNAVVSLFFMCSFASALLSVCSLARPKRYFALLCISMLVSTLLCAAHTGNFALGFARNKKNVLFLSVLFFLYALAEGQVSKPVRQLVLWAPAAVGSMFLCAYFVLGNRTKMVWAITLNFANPNTAGMWLYVLLLFAVVQWLSVRRLWQKGLIALYGAGLFYLLWETRNRSGLLVVLFFLFLLLAYPLARRRPFKKGLTVLCVLLPLLVAGAYMLVVLSPAVSRLFSFLVSPGKPLSSRMSVWKYALEQFVQHPLFGNGYEIMTHPLGQMHNIYLEAFASYGAVTGILLMVFYGRIMQAVQREGAVSYAAACAFAAIWFAGGAFEAGILTGCTGLSYLAGMLLVLAKYEG